MLPVCIASISPFAGKDVVAVGMAEKLCADGKRVGYFKPYGPLPARRDDNVVDEDAEFFKEILDLSETVDTLCPVVIDDATVSRTLQGEAASTKERVLEAYRAASEQKDVTLVMSMGNMTCGETFGFPMSELVREVDAQVVVVDRYRWPMETLDGLIRMKAELGNRLAGVIFNNVLASRRAQIEQQVAPFLRQRSIPVFGLVMEDALLRAVTVSQLVAALGARVLCCEEALDELVEHLSIGAMNAESALRFFRRMPNKAVITGGDRADIHMAALETSTRCLILTGDLHPNERILARAEDLGVPVLLAGQESAAAAEACERAFEHRSLHSEKKIRRIKSLMEQHLDWKLLAEKLHLS